MIGPYDSPQVRLPGAGGAPEIASSAGRVIVVLRHSPRSFVEHLDFRTSVPGRSGTAVITDLGMLDAGDDGELVLTAVHPGVSVDDVQGATGWDLRVAPGVAVTPDPTRAELDALRSMSP